MRRHTIFSLLLLLAVTATSCEFVNSKILKNSIRGTYRNSKGEKLDFTESTVTMAFLGTRNCKVEDGYLIIEDMPFGELKHGGIRFRILHPDTLVGDNGKELDSEDLEVMTFTKVKE